MVFFLVEIRDMSRMVYIKYLFVLVKFFLRFWSGGLIWMIISVIREWINRNVFYKVVIFLVDSKLKCCII